MTMTNAPTHAPAHTPASDPTSPGKRPRPAAPAAKPTSARAHSVGTTFLQWMLAAGSLTAVVVGATGLARQDTQLPANVAPAPVATLPRATGMQIQVEGLPRLDLPPIPARPALDVPVRPVARSRSSR